MESVAVHGADRSSRAPPSGVNRRFRRRSSFDRSHNNDNDDDDDDAHLLPGQLDRFGYGGRTHRTSITRRTFPLTQVGAGIPVAIS